MRRNASYSYKMVEHLEILNKIFLDTEATLWPTRPMYTFTAAVYDTWHAGTELEKNLAARLTDKWKVILNGEMECSWSAARKRDQTPSSCNSLKPFATTRDTYCQKWIDDKYTMYKDHEGLRCALRNIWSDKYGVREVW